jgi:hypothetical protein
MRLRPRRDSDCPGSEGAGTAALLKMRRGSPMTKSTDGTEKLATWKFRLENTVLGDPLAPKDGLKIIRVYLDEVRDWNSRPYASTIDLRAKTRLPERAVLDTRKALVHLGYLVPRGKHTSGTIRYEVRNPRAEEVEHHIVTEAARLRAVDAAKKQASRAKMDMGNELGVSPNEMRGTDKPSSPSKVRGTSPNETQGMSPADMRDNTVAVPVDMADAPQGARQPQSSSYEKTAPSSAPEGAEGASVSSADVDDFDDFFKDRDFEEFSDEESPSEFIQNGNSDLPIRSTPEGWRNLLAWIGDIYGPAALKRAVAEKRTGTLTIETILNFQGGAADVA